MFEGLATPSPTSPLLRPLGRIKTASCPRGRSELVREDGRSGDACSKAWRPLRGQVRSYARWAESKRPPARGVGANLFAKTVV
ncbi:hypothetical protein GIV15_09110 [Pseudomonas syringae]|nr:hypothetical protein [Pseudomonas syringae]